MAEIKTSPHGNNSNASREKDVHSVDPSKLDVSDVLAPSKLNAASDVLASAALTRSTHTHTAAKKRSIIGKKRAVPHHKHSEVKRVSFASLHHDNTLELPRDKRTSHTTAMARTTAPKDYDSHPYARSSKRRAQRRNSFVIHRRRGCPFLRPSCLMTEESQRVASSLDALELAIQQEALHNLTLPSEADSDTEMQTELE